MQMSAKGFEQRDLNDNESAEQRDKRADIESGRWRPSRHMYDKERRKPPAVGDTLVDPYYNSRHQWDEIGERLLSTR